MSRKNKSGRVLDEHARLSNSAFNRGAASNAISWIQYHDKLTELAISSIEWDGMPDEIDMAFVERCLFYRGAVVFFKDEALDQYVCLPFMTDSAPDIYNNPIKRIAFAANGYQYAGLDKSNSVIIYNNLLKLPSTLDMEIFSRRLAEIDEIMKVNLKAQKTPVLIVCDESQRLSMKNLYMQYEGNEPFIFGDKAQLNPNSIQALQTGAPYLLNQLWDAKTKTWNEALTYLGISNVASQKKERMLIDEVTRNQGGTIANRYSRLEARRNAAKQISLLFGLDIDVRYRDDTNPAGESTTWDDNYNDQLEEDSQNLTSDKKAVEDE